MTTPLQPWFRALAQLDPISALWLVENHGTWQTLASEESPGFQINMHAESIGSALLWHKSPQLREHWLDLNQRVIDFMKSEKQGAPQDKYTVIAIRNPPLSVDIARMARAFGTVVNGVTNLPTYELAYQSRAELLSSIQADLKKD